MSDTATAPAPAAPAATPAPSAPAVATPAPAAPFLASPTPAQATPANLQPSPIFGGHVSDDGRFKEGWTENLRAAGLETLAGKLSTAKDEKGALRMLEDSVKLASRRELKGGPNEGWQDHEVAEFRRAHGVPEEAGAYKLKPEALPAGVAWDDNFAGEFAKVAHANHIPEAAAKALVDFHLQQVAASAGSNQAALSDNLTKLTSASETEFRKEWGPDFDTRVEANRAFTNVRFTPEELSDPLIQAALSHPKIVRLVDEARRSLREAPLPGVQQGSPGSQSPQQQAEAMMASNPGWRKDPSLAGRIHQLMALQSQTSKRA